jgi:hypothetical protein
VAEFWSDDLARVQHEENLELTRRENLARNEAEDAFNAQYSPEEIRQMVKEGEQKAALEQSDAEQIKFMSKFVRDNPWYVNNLHNRDVIIRNIHTIVEKTGRQYADWGEHDFRLALDAAADEGELLTNGPYVRQGPDVDAMTTDEIQGLAYEQQAGIRRRTT